MRWLRNLIEDLVIARRIAERDARDDGSRTSLRVVAADLGVDLDEL